MNTATVFGFLCLASLVFAQNAAAGQPQFTKSAPAAQSSSPAKAAQAETPTPAKTQEQAAKPAVKIDPEKEAAIRRLFDLTETRKTMEQVLTGMSANMRPTLSKMLPPGEYQDKLLNLFFERFRGKLKTDDLLDLAIPVYDKYLSKEDIDGLSQFYQTPLGKKMVSVLPQVLIESQTAAMHLGEEIGRQSMLEVLAENPELAKALEEAGARKN